MNLTKIKVLAVTRLKSQSLFFRLLASFLIIILLLVSFILFSLVFFRDNIKEEIIKYNTLNLKNTTDNFEKQFEFIENTATTFSLSDKVTQLAVEQKLDYYVATKTMDDIKQTLSSPFLYLENLILLFKHSSFALEKSRGSGIETLFTRYYNNDSYPYRFWLEQFDRQYRTKIMPGFVFSELEWDEQKTNPRNLIPIVIKNSMNSDFYMIAMVDAQKMFNAFHHSINNQFIIMSDEQTPYFSSSGAEKLPLPAFKGSQGFVKQGNNYIFYKKGAHSGLTYVNIIPDDNIYQEIRWNFTFLLLLVLSIVISVVASFLFTVKLNEPVKKIVDSIQQLHLPLRWRSSINEFNIIRERVGHILQVNRDIHQDLAEKKSLLRHYAYMNKLKKIRSNNDEWKDIIATDRPFVLILFQLTFKTRMNEELEVEEDRATSYITEFINHVVTEKTDDSITFQIETDQILSIVFTMEENAVMDGILQNVKQVIELEKEYCFLTIAVPPRSADLYSCYKAAMEMVKSRKFNDDTQIICELARGHASPVPLEREEDFDMHLKNGNTDLLLQMINRALSQLRKKEACAADVIDFARGLLQKMHKALLIRNIGADFMQQTLEQLYRCVQYEQLEQLFAGLIPQVTRLINDKKDKKDPIIQFVYEYLGDHYDQDVTLDSLAEKLNISRSYLSTYFKERSGVYFVDYINSVRINKAKELLLHSDMKIQDAAAKVGYQNINSFNRMFKKMSGITPSEYRKSIIGGGAS